MARLVFKTTPQELRAAAQSAIASATDILNAIASSPASFETTLEGYARMENELTTSKNVLSIYQFVSADEDLRQASKTVYEELSAFEIDATKRLDVYTKIKEVYNSGEKLGPLDQRYLHKVYNELKSAGLDLSVENRKKLTLLRKELSQATIEFQANLAGDNSYKLYTAQQLAGVPNIERFEKENEKYKFTFKFPDYTSVMQSCTVEATRKEIFVSDQNRCPENEAQFKRALELRREIAQLLGYQTAAAQILEDRMAHDPETVRAFLTDLIGRSALLAEKEREEYLVIKKELDPTATTVYAWDAPFLRNMVLKRRYKVDQEAISEYFELEHTVKMMFGVFSELMDLEFRPVPLSEDEKWHPEVECFAIYQSGELKGDLYLDNYPRPHKWGHFANVGLRKGNIDASGKHLPCSILLCNFPRPTSDNSALLKHSDVVTFFHELGHGIHSTLGLTKYARFSGTKTQKDFVETPSQLLENWTWNKPQLKKVAKHYKTGEPIPEPLLDELVASRYANQGTYLVGQLFYGLFDLNMHDSAHPDPFSEWMNLRESVIKIPCPEPLRGYNQFGHLMGGYECGYYGYLWSLVYSADIWATRFAANPQSASTGAAYRDEILAKGYSEDPAELLKRFLGREPNSDAFFGQLGLGATPTPLGY